METPECFHAWATSCAQEKDAAGAGGKGGERQDCFIVEDLLNFFNEDEDCVSADFGPCEEAGSDGTSGNSTDSPTVTVVYSCGEVHFPGEAFGRCLAAGQRIAAAVHGGDGEGVRRVPLADVGLSGDLCEPYDELAGLEWLSNFVDESFSSKDLHTV